MPSALIGVNPDCKITELNSQAKNLAKQNNEEINGKSVDIIFPQLKNKLEAITQTINSNTLYIKRRVASKTDTQTKYFDLTIYPLNNKDYHGAVIRLDDVTEKVYFEQLMIQTEKMMSIGGLAAGMAHEINNPLAGIMQNIQLIKTRLDSNLARNRNIAVKNGISFDDVQTYIDKRDINKMLTLVTETSVRAAKIVKNILSFAKKGNSKFTENSITSLLDQTKELATNDYNLKKKYDFKQIKIIREYDKNLPLINCEHSEIQQVFLNILKNGAEAMSEYGTKNPRFIFKVQQEMNMLKIEIEDNGPGIDKDVQKRIFEPFFTTKQTIKGTGLGLSISYFIITEEHQGQMLVESEKDKGTKFIIRLPLEHK